MGLTRVGAGGLAAAFLLASGNGVAAMSEPQPGLSDTVVSAVAGDTMSAAASVGTPEPPVLRGSDPSGADTMASAPAWLRDATISYRLRTFIDHQNIDDSLIRYAAVQGLMASFHSGLTPGPLGFGLDVTAFAALRAVASPNAGNMGHQSPEGGPASPAWAYPGLVYLRAETTDVSVKVGAQMISNPFLEPSFNRALPPTFFGTTASWRATPLLTLQSAYVTKGVSRGQTGQSTITTSYGGVDVNRFYSLGLVRDNPGEEKLSIFLGQAENVWRQLNVETAAPLVHLGDVTIRGDADAYVTTAAGARREGPIDNLAYSLALIAARRTGRLAVSYQQIASRQFFDYLAQTWGETLENASVVDFNAPREQSVKLRIVFGAEELGVRGLKLAAWATVGWGADGRLSAARHADPADALHSLYWRNGAPIAGRHNEVGLNPAYIVPEGRLRNTKLALILAVHRSDHSYSDPAVHEYRITLDVPFD